MELVTQDRSVTGKKVKHLRTEGLIPAVFYGRGMENKNVVVDRKGFEKLFAEAGESTIIKLVVGGEKRPVIIHNVQRDSLSGDVIHIDFYGVRMDEKITATVPLEFTGSPPAVKESGGVLSKNILEIEVEALPGDLPHTLAVDLGSLAEIGSSIYVKDIEIPSGATVDLDPETVVATVSEPREEEEEVPPEEIDVSAVKVEGEEKKAEREAQEEGEEGEKGEKNA